MDLVESMDSNDRSMMGQRRAPRARGWWVFVVAGLAAGTAWAEPSEADKDLAGLLMDRGDEAFRQEAYKNALQSYQQADQIMRVPSTGVAVATALERLGRLTEARAVAVQVTKMPPRQNEPEAFARAREKAARMLTLLDTRIPTVEIVVTGVASGVEPEVDVDLARLPRSALSSPVQLDPGRHAITATAPGHESTTTSVTVVEGDRRRITLELRGRMDHGGQSQADLDGDAQSVPTLAYAAFGVGAAGLVVGGVTGWLTISKSRDLEDACGGTVCPTSYEQDLDSAQRMSRVSNVSFAVGAAGVATGLILLFTADPTSAGSGSRTPSTTTGLTPAVGYQQWGIAGVF